MRFWISSLISGPQMYIILARHCSYIEAVYSLEKIRIIGWDNLAHPIDSHHPPYSFIV